MTHGSDTDAVLIAVGDIMPDRSLRPPRVFKYLPATATSISSYRSAPPIPFTNTEHYRAILNEKGVMIEDIMKTSHSAESTIIEIPDDEDHGYPFRNVRHILSEADIVFGNLECPLSTRGRPIKNDLCYRASPEFASTLAAANFNVISFSNNHSMDYGENAFFDTLDILRRHGIHTIGAGKNDAEAREPALLNIRNTRLAFLAYNLVGPDIVYALSDECGVAPLNEVVLQEDIDKVRDKVDLVIISAHWGSEGESKPANWLVDMGRKMIDLGADIILGHHPHIPGSIEIYKSKPIIYSLGNFIFGHSHNHWGDNIMVKIVISERACSRLEVIPIGSKGVEIFQPIILSGERAMRLLKYIEYISRPYGAAMSAHNDYGVINVGNSRREGAIPL
jgi:poly-gamma-glutamate synthesis protein (capsule biosynthesis protein)